MLLKSSSRIPFLLLIQFTIKTENFPIFVCKFLGRSLLLVHQIANKKAIKSFNEISLRFALWLLLHFPLFLFRLLFSFCASSLFWKDTTRPKISENWLRNALMSSSVMRKRKYEIKFFVFRLMVAIGNKNRKNQMKVDFNGS